MLTEFILFFLSLVVLIIWLEKSRQKKHQQPHGKEGMKELQRPPGPFPLPYLGSIFQMGYTLLLHRGLYPAKLHKLCQKYGKVFGVQVGIQYYVVIEDFETAKEVMNSPYWTPRFPSRPLFKEHTYDQNLGLMWSSGEAWREMRRFTSRTLKNFGFGELKSAEGFIQEELDCFTERVDSDRGKNNNEILMRQYFKIPTFNVLWRTMSGQRFTYDDPKIKEIIHYVEDVAQIQIGSDLEWGFPLLRKIPGMSKSLEKTKSFDGIHEFFENIMKERREKGTFRESQTDFMDFFLAKVEEERGNEETMYTDEQFVCTCVDLLFGGVDTTANSLEFAVLYMLKYPDVQEKVRQEIFSVIGRNRIPTNADRAKLPYLEATMLEVLRHANVVPLNGRTSLCDTTLNGYFIPKDTLAGLNLTVIHSDPSIWGDPEAFRPERFLDQNNKIINDDKLFAFGNGKRQCLGYTMAKVIMLSFFTRIIQRYSLERSQAHPKLDTTPDPGVANNCKPFYCKFNLIE